MQHGAACGGANCMLCRPESRLSSSGAAALSSSVALPSPLPARRLHFSLPQTQSPFGSGAPAEDEELEERALEGSWHELDLANSMNVNVLRQRKEEKARRASLAAAEERRRLSVVEEEQQKWEAEESAEERGSFVVRVDQWESSSSEESVHDMSWEDSDEENVVLGAQSAEQLLQQKIQLVSQRSKAGVREMLRDSVWHRKVLEQVQLQRKKELSMFLLEERARQEAQDAQLQREEEERWNAHRQEVESAQASAMEVVRRLQAEMRKVREREERAREKALREERARQESVARAKAAQEARERKARQEAAAAAKQKEKEKARAAAKEKSAEKKKVTFDLTPQVAPRQQKAVSARASEEEKKALALVEKYAKQKLLVSAATVVGYETRKDIWLAHVAKHDKLMQSAKRALRQMKGPITRTINQLSRSRDVVLTKTKFLLEKLREAEEISQDVSDVALYWLAKKLSTQIEVKAAIDKRNVFCYSAVVVMLCSAYPRLWNLVLGACEAESQYLVPIFILPEAGESGDDYMTRIGCRNEHQFIQNHMGYIKFFAALCATPQDGDNSSAPSDTERHLPHLPDLWLYLAAILNLRPAFLSPQIVYDVITTAGAELLAVYKNQFKKLLRYILEVWIPMSEKAEQTMDGIPNVMLIKRLKMSIEDILKNGGVAQPKGKFFMSGNDD